MKPVKSFYSKVLTGLEGRASDFLVFGYDELDANRYLPNASYSNLVYTMNKYGFFFGPKWAIE